MPTIEERKRHRSKPDQFYTCDEVHRESGYIVIRYDVTREGRIGDAVIPAGSHTLAHYRAATGYVLWEMIAGNGRLIGYCYHICEPPQIGPDYVDYLDLYLDLWYAPDGAVTLLDEDELDAAVAAGHITEGQATYARSQAELVRREHEAIIAALWSGG